MGSITTRDMTGRGVLMGKRARQESAVCGGPVNQSSASDWMTWVTKLDAESCALYVRICMHGMCVSMCVCVCECECTCRDQR